jgi:signal transduction histidine kinase
MIINTAKHSNASKVKIEFSLLYESNMNKKLYIRVEDNGVGFDTDRTYTGNGLKNLKSQSEAIDGDIIIASKKGNGALYLFSLLIKK